MTDLSSRAWPCKPSLPSIGVETQWGTSTGYVYFAGIGYPYVTHVKIGYSMHDPRARVRALRTGCPFKIRLLGLVIGNLALEQDLHVVLDNERREGEWFVMSDFADRVVRVMLKGCG